jgi:hypothetical protein
MSAAGGGNSREPMRRALAARQRSGPALVVHTDIPSNDFSGLFELVAGDPRNHLGAEGVFACRVLRAAFESSLWVGLDRGRDRSQRDAIAGRFHSLLRERIADAPEEAARRWPVVVLDIARV